MRCLRMKKPLNVLSKSAMAAVLASSALVPVAVQAAEAPVSVDKILVEKDGKIFELSYDVFNELTGEGHEFKIVNVVVNNKTFKVEDFNEAFGESETLAEATATLDAEELYHPVKVDVAGNVTAGENGPQFNDETPEEKVNETFFYNLAA